MWLAISFLVVVVASMCYSHLRMPPYDPHLPETWRPTRRTVIDADPKPGRTALARTGDT